MSMLNTEVLANLNRERHADLVREAETVRLLRDIEKSVKQKSPVNATEQAQAAPTGLLATLLALPGRFKMA